MGVDDILNLSKQKKNLKGLKAIHKRC